MVQGETQASCVLKPLSLYKGHSAAESENAGIAVCGDLLDVLSEIMHPGASNWECVHWLTASFAPLCAGPRQETLAYPTGSISRRCLLNRMPLL